MVSHTFIIRTDNTEAAADIAAAAEKHQSEIDIDYEVVNHIRQVRGTDV
jgi:hypothetical protein